MIERERLRHESDRLRASLASEHTQMMRQSEHLAAEHTQMQFEGARLAAKNVELQARADGLSRRLQSSEAHQVMEHSRWAATPPTEAPSRPSTAWMGSASEATDRVYITSPSLHQSPAYYAWNSAPSSAMSTRPTSAGPSRPRPVTYSMAPHE